MTMKRAVVIMRLKGIIELLVQCSQTEGQILVTVKLSMKTVITITA